MKWSRKLFLYIQLLDMRKWIKPLEVKQKKGETGMEHGKRELNRTQIQFHRMIYRDYKLIKKFKTGFNTSYSCRFLWKKWSGLQRKRILWSKIKKLWCNDEKSNKRNSLRMSSILRDKIISSKKAQMERVYAVTKKMFKAGKCLATTVQWVNLKTLFTVFCSNLYHLITLKIKEYCKGVGSYL